MTKSEIKELVAEVEASMDAIARRGAEKDTSCASSYMLGGLESVLADVLKKLDGKEHDIDMFKYYRISA